MSKRLKEWLANRPTPTIRIEYGIMRDLYGKIAGAISAAIDALPACCDANGYTYLIVGADRVKIGRSIDPAKRSSTLQGASPVELSLFAISRGDIEGQLHTICSEYRTHGEWFLLSGVKHALRIEIARSRALHMCLRCALSHDARETKRLLGQVRAA